ncbi:Wzz/FepE/Etk N-terminal domain-containing protein [Brumimicrobium oceani]|uniref:Polysaccharide chain length determinant N-terminal domain-containing protein n=1 Tax=Brumimicrobium oceani TaxID=2100725 RepID=A0A2U2XGQ6_9FLAO|nr:Wzz/FepE/Etk N-terminal domain-containing protein [Brumimicrobium oceani]PWH86974.1 hypothetical protein DIT68_01570 [Brumimicrobium oceani]
MKINSKTFNAKNEFDLFYTIVKNWKPILIFSLAFSLVGIGYVFIIPKTYTSSTAFSISLDKTIETAYGNYPLKTQNPSHYLSLFDSRGFKDDVSKSFKKSELGEFRFKIIKERLDLPPNRKHLIFPSKFKLRVIGTNKTQLNSISDTAISSFLAITDKKLGEDMYHYYFSTLQQEVEKLQFNIQTKNSFIESLNIDTSNRGELSSESLTSLDSLKTRLLDGAQMNNNTLLISSMLLNEGKGAKNYLDAVLTVEQVELKKLQNELKNKKLLLDKLNDQEKKLHGVFDKPFSNSFISLSVAELQEDKWLSNSIKQILIFFLAGFFIGSVVVSFRIYYK